MTTSTIPHLELAKLLAHKLARITNAPAYVVADGNHPMLACAGDFGGDGELPYWTKEQIIFTAPAPGAEFVDTARD